MAAEVKIVSLIIWRPRKYESELTTCTQPSELTDGHTRFEVPRSAQCLVQLFNWVWNNWEPMIRIIKKKNASDKHSILSIDQDSDCRISYYFCYIYYDRYIYTSRRYQSMKINNQYNQYKSIINNIN